MEEGLAIHGTKAGELSPFSPPHRPLVRRRHWPAHGYLTGGVSENRRGATPAHLRPHRDRQDLGRLPAGSQPIDHRKVAGRAYQRALCFSPESPQLLHSAQPARPPGRSLKDLRRGGRAFPGPPGAHPDGGYALGREAPDAAPTAGWKTRIFRKSCSRPTAWRSRRPTGCSTS